MTDHTHTAACGTDQRDCLRTALAESISSERRRPSEAIELGAIIALRLVAERDPEAMAAVGLTVDEAMFLRGLVAAQTTVDPVGTALSLTDLAKLTHAALEAALGGEGRG